MKNKKPVILIVEDSLMVADRLGDMLKESLPTRWVVKAGNYQQGLQYIEHFKPDIVLMDIQLPDGNGLDLLRYIRKKQPSAKVFIVSNHTHEYYRRLGESFGAHHFFDKSNEFDQIPKYLAEYN